MSVGWGTEFSFVAMAYLKWWGRLLCESTTETKLSINAEGTRKEGAHEAVQRSIYILPPRFASENGSRLTKKLEKYPIDLQPSAPRYREEVTCITFCITAFRLKNGARWPRKPSDRPPAVSSEISRKGYLDYIIYHCVSPRKNGATDQENVGKPSKGPPTDNCWSIRFEWSGWWVVTKFRTGSRYTAFRLRKKRGD